MSANKSEIAALIKQLELHLPEEKTELLIEKWGEQSLLCCLQIALESQRKALQRKAEHKAQWDRMGKWHAVELPNVLNPAKIEWQHKTK